MKKSKVILPINNPAQGTSSNQPTGTTLPGPKQAVMPVTSSTPANPPPATNNTREDDKPLPKTVREGMTNRKKTKQQAEAQRKKKEKAEQRAELVRKV